MKHRLFAAALFCVSALSAPLAQAPDASEVLRNAARAMGVDTLNAIHYYGTASQGNLGQNNNANQPWPMAGLNDYVRAIDFTQPASRATWATYAIPVQGGRATLAVGTPQTQQLITPQNQAWAQQLEIWITPWGFIKGAIANHATVRAQVTGGSRTQVVTWNAPIKVAWRAALSRGRLSEHPEPGHARADVARASRVW